MAVVQIPSVCPYFNLFKTFEPTINYEYTKNNF